MSTFMETGYKRPQGARSKWTTSFKIHVVKTLIEKNLTYMECVRQFNIPRATLKMWAQQYHYQFH
jgi:transposase-like protein